MNLGHSHGPSDAGGGIAEHNRRQYATGNVHKLLKRWVDVRPCLFLPPSCMSMMAGTMMSACLLLNPGCSSDQQTFSLTMLQDDHHWTVHSSLSTQAVAPELPSRPDACCLLQMPDRMNKQLVT